MRRQYRHRHRIKRLDPPIHPAGHDELVGADGEWHRESRWPRDIHAVAIPADRLNIALCLRDELHGRLPAPVTAHCDVRPRTESARRGIDTNVDTGRDLLAVQRPDKHHLMAADRQRDRQVPCRGDHSPVVEPLPLRSRGPIESRADGDGAQARHRIGKHPVRESTVQNHQLQLMQSDLVEGKVDDLTTTG